MEELRARVLAQIPNAGQVGQHPAVGRELRALMQTEAPEAHGVR